LQGKGSSGITEVTHLTMGQGKDFDRVRERDRTFAGAIKQAKI
jgi:hypothetical protein